jgi:hypothetical protein
MNRVQIPFGGITTSPQYGDGDCCLLQNLRNRNGALQPVTPRATAWTASQQYEIVFLHRHNDYENRVGTSHSVAEEWNYTFIYWKIDGIREEIGWVPGEIKAISQIGNTLSFYADAGIYYALFKDGDYIFLGKEPEAPRVSAQMRSIMSRDYYWTWIYESEAVHETELIEGLKGLMNKSQEWYIYGGTTRFGDAIAPIDNVLFDAHLVQLAYRLYDGTLIKYGPPLLVMPADSILGMKTVTYTATVTEAYDIRVTIHGYKFSLSIYNPAYNLWRDIIKSIDVFISPALSISDAERIRTDFPFTPVGADTYTLNLIESITPEMMERVSEESKFYLLHSIPNDSYLNTYLFPNSRDDIEKLKNITHAEMMPLDPFSNHDIIPKGSYEYNSRVHLFDITTSFFKGYTPDCFEIISDFNGVARPGSLTTGRFIAEIEISMGETAGLVYSTLTAQSGWYMFLNPMLSYPDPRATRMTLYEVVSETEWKKIFSAALKPHTALNIAYRLNDGLAPVIPALSESVASKPTDTTVLLREPNKLKVSELNNPFLYPNRTTYTVGDGRILNVATNSMRVSDQNYGLHPLFVFATDGVWTMNVGDGDVLYTTVAAPTSGELPVSDVVCGTPFGVVFISRRGLMLINGDAIEWLSRQLDGVYAPLTVERPPEAEGVIAEMPEESFADFLNGTKMILYDPRESELILAGAKNEGSRYYNYVYNFGAQMFYLSTERIDMAVQNAAPELYVIDSSGGFTVRDYAVPAGTKAAVCLMTRPLRFGTTDMKKLDRMILRGLLYGLDSPAAGKKALFAIHHSMDGAAFTLTRGIVRNPCSCVDADMGLMARTKFRDYLFSFGALLEEKSVIRYVDSEIIEEYNNTKMR